MIRLIALLALALVVLGFTPIAAPAATAPRPWLCREIPVFSSPQPMIWRAKKTGAGRWLMAFMRYDPAGGHDGFTLVSTREVGSSASASLPAGQYYAVALHLMENHWICPANASDSEEPPARAISQICYGRDDDSCDVTLTITPAR
jgi:hypothetical protein